jgi:hypothetical protein
MSQDNAFDKLVRELDDTALAGLAQAVNRESGDRRQQNSIPLEAIHPRMSDTDRQRVKDQIARVLRGEE